MRVLVVTCAKVGSASFLHSLQEQHDVAHFHSLDTLEHTIRALPPSLPEAERPIIVSGFRDPIARNMSYFFQTFTDNFVNNLGEFCYVGSRDEISRMTTGELIETFLKMPYHETPIDWFRRAFRLLRIEDPFEKAAGISVIERPNVVLMLYRLEDLSSNVNRICKFFGIDSFQMANRSSDRWYKARYERFKNEICFHPNYVDALYENEVMRYFYTDAEIMRFRSRYRIC